MGSRLYFNAVEPAPMTPNSIGGWDRISEAGDYKLSRTIGDDADFVEGTIIGPWSPGQKALDRRYVSDALEAQMVGGLSSMQLMVEEIGSTFDVVPHIQMWIVKPDGTPRGTLMNGPEEKSGSYQSDSYDYRNHKMTWRRRKNAVFAKKGDRIVIAMGHTDSSGLGSRARSLWGNPPPPVTDLPENDSTETVRMRGWVEFHKVIIFSPGVPDPNVHEKQTDKDFTFVTSRVFAAPTSVPNEGIDERLLLVRPVGSPARGFTFQTMRVMDGFYQRMEWWQHRNGGCGSFRLHLRDPFPEQDPALSEGWEIHVQVKLPNDNAYTLWYRGVIRSCHASHGGNEVMTEIRGYGYVEQLNFIQVQKTYPAGMSVSDVVNDIQNKFIRPHSRIVRPNELYPTDDNGVDVSNYQLKGDVHFECSALKALKFLSELQGDREFGVDERRCIYFRSNVNIAVLKSFYLTRDTINMIGGGKAFDRLNQMKVQGKQFTGREYLKVHPDVTDVTNSGLFERASEVPWVTDDRDADKWADSIIDQHRTRESWVNFQWQGISARLDAFHPFGKCYFYGADTSNEKQLLSVTKIQYIKGGFGKKGELVEIGTPIQQSTLHQPVMNALVYLGASRKDLVEELERNVYDPLAAIQGKLRQFRNPASGQILPSEGHVVGEPFALFDPTSQRSARYVWDATEWIPQSQCRIVRILPAYGLFRGETVFLVTDVTTGTGSVYTWTGGAWVIQGSGSGGGTYDLLSDPVFWALGG
jgi:hypothetical protein